MNKYPSEMDDSSLSSHQNDSLLNKDLLPNVDFVWIPNASYQRFLEWFGLKIGTPTFQRQIIRIDNSLMTDQDYVFILRTLMWL